MALAPRYALVAAVLSSAFIPLATAHAQTAVPARDTVETVSAAEYPDEPVIYRIYRYPVVVGAHIGFRRSLDAGERSALKWLSRLVKENPKARTYVVRWHTMRNGRHIPILTTYTFGTAQLTQVQFLTDQSPESKMWRPVLIQELHSVARRNGSMASFRRVKREVPKVNKPEINEW